MRLYSFALNQWFEYEEGDSIIVESFDYSYDHYTPEQWKDIYMDMADDKYPPDDAHESFQEMSNDDELIVISIFKTEESRYDILAFTTWCNGADEATKDTINYFLKNNEKLKEEALKEEALTVEVVEEVVVEESIEEVKEEVIFEEPIEVKEGPVNYRRKIKRW